MDPLKLMNTPVEILKLWLPALETELEYDAKQIEVLEAEIGMKKINMKHTEQVKDMLKFAIALQELPPRS